MSRIKFSVLDKKELDFFKNRIERLLSERGIEMNHPEMKAALEKEGCMVKENHVYFPKQVIDKAIERVPKEFDLYAPDEKYNLHFPNENGDFYTRTCTGAPYYLNVQGEKHSVDLKDTEDWFHLTNCLENIDFVALPSACDENIPGEAIDIFTLEKALEVSKKHIWIQPYEAENVKYLLEMCKAAAGGAEELKEKPIVSFISCSVPVLKFKYMDAEILYQCAKAGVPVQPCSLPTAGANTPITAQGTALVACADVLAQIVMLELLCPGLPVIATTLLFSMDMLTTYTLQSNTEITLGRLLCMQVFEEGYGIPAHSYGTGSDSMKLDGQNMIERTSLIHEMAMSDASILGGAGQLETAKTISPLQLIIDDEIFGIAKRLRRGLKIDDETLDFEEVLEGDDQDGYLMSEHTMDHFREIHRPELFYKGHLRDIDDEERDLLDRAMAQYEKYEMLPRASILTEERKNKIHDIVKSAETNLTKHKGE